MSKIQVTNSAVIINDYNLGDCEKLEGYFKSWDPITHSNFFIGLHYDEDNKKLYLPRGIDIWLVEQLLDFKAELMVNGYYRFKRFSDMYMKYKPRDDVQKETLRFMIGVQEYTDNQKRSQLSVNLSTGKGKTYVTIATLAYFAIRGIVITSSVEWLRQWADRTCEYTNIKPNEIYNISGSGNVFRLLDMDINKLDKYKLFLVTHDTLQSFGKNNGWDMVGKLFEHLQIGIKIFDEAHLNFDNMCMIDFYTNVFKTYYLTATPSKSDYRANIIYQNAFKNVPSISLFDEKEDPHTDYFAIHYNSDPTPYEVSSCYTSKYGLDRNKYTNYVVKKENFYKLLTIIMDIGLKNTRVKGTKMLIYIGTNKAIDIVYNWLIENFWELRDDIGIYNSVVSKEEKTKALTKRCILSTTKSAGAAVDIPGLVMTVVLAEPFKSEVITRQSLGRTRADNTLYVEVVDKGFKKCLDYYYSKQSIIDTYAKSRNIIRLNNKELNDRYDLIMSNRHPLITLVERI